MNSIFAHENTKHQFRIVIKHHKNVNFIILWNFFNLKATSIINDGFVRSYEKLRFNCPSGKLQSSGFLISSSNTRPTNWRPTSILYEYARSYQGPLTTNFFSIMQIHCRFVFLIVRKSTCLLSRRKTEAMHLREHLRILDCMTDQRF